MVNSLIFISFFLSFLYRKMTVFDCLSIMIPLVSSMLALQFFSTISSMVPLPTTVAQPFLTVVIMYILTAVYAKIQCWKSDKAVTGRAIVPVLIFLAWVAAFIFPVTAPIMMVIGNSPFLIVALSLLYKIVYDKMFEC
jgi:hypothetical protein